MCNILLDKDINTLSKQRLSFSLKTYLIKRSEKNVYKTAHLTDIPDTTVVTTITDSKETKDSNGISTVDTTIYPVTNVGNGTTPHHTDILETTDTMLTNSEKITQLYKITTDSTTLTTMRELPVIQLKIPMTELQIDLRLMASKHLSEKML